MSSNIYLKITKKFTTVQNIDMWDEHILDCLKRKRDICIRTIIPSQNTAFIWTPALIKVGVPRMFFFTIRL